MTEDDRRGEATLDSMSLFAAGAAVESSPLSVTVADVWVLKAPHEKGFNRQATRSDQTSVNSVREPSESPQRALEISKP